MFFYLALTFYLQARCDGSPYDINNKYHIVCKQPFDIYYLYRMAELLANGLCGFVVDRCVLVVVVGIVGFIMDCCVAAGTEQNKIVIIICTTC